MSAVGVVLNVLLCVSPPSVAFGLVKLDAAQWAVVVGVTFSLISLGEFFINMVESAKFYGII